MNRLEEFNQHRPFLFSIAYRMLGSVVDAEDMVQETFLRWQQVAEDTVQSAKAYLSSIITRLCIDHLRSARVQREQYVGPWLPEPILTEQMPDPAKTVELVDTLSTAFLVLLETLSPLERAVFLLREVFDYDYDEIGQIVDKSPTNCRQIVRRAKQHLTSRRPRFEVSLHSREQMTEKFLQACNVGDLQGLIGLLAEDITLWSDGGGQVTAALKPLHGSVKVAKFLLAIRSKKLANYVSRIAKVNDQPGIINYIGVRVGATLQYHFHSVMTFDFKDERIQSVFIVVNPDKLKQLADSNIKCQLAQPH
ncbi:RNA polymerase sigma-70 factor [Brasilonema octagenarum UFV-E1]|uniref:RNA polymerase sigma-70 factor n=1 Tax=Brasilonema sennae CENA114 TaxID=415709 RepID=A0A856MN08_9CYAN|nr:RNA polymerase sigma-70 factor [Brasilonema sennae]QDL11494.1 RNA polymerase sigma-70 factor [Brasilonema sennae CENA114]QDL17877.1 RNA polymerase sigma-70 factor [Brasilonema octagenarum UFV-E1]